MNTGVHGNYQWLETERDLNAFLAACAGVIVDRHIAITSTDSGVFTPNAVDVANGWTSKGDIAWSPRLRSPAGLPTGGYDEWYVFEAPVELGNLQRDQNIFTAKIAPGQVFTFVNFPGFRPADPAMIDLTALFWKQLDWMQPESYLAGGSDQLIFATRNEALFNSAKSALEDPAAALNSPQQHNRLAPPPDDET